MSGDAGAPVLLTGCAGFIGMHTTLALLGQGREGLWAVGARTRPGPQSIYRRALTK